MSIKTTLSAAYKFWLELLKSSKSERTVRKYETYLRPLVERLGEFPLSELAGKKAYITGLAVSLYSTPATRKSFSAAWSSFRQFVEDQYGLKLPELPKDFRGKTELKEPKPLKEEHFQALLEAVRELPDTEREREKNVSFKLVFFLQAFAGLRLGEALKVRPSDVQFKRTPDGQEYAEITVKGKGAKERRVPIFVPFVVSYLKEFWTELPPSISAYGFNKRLKNLYRKAVVGIGEQPERIHAHRLRDTYLTRLADRGVDIRVLQELAGHSSVEMTRRYLGVSRERILQEVSRVF